MKAVLLRVGIDSGSGGIQGPLFSDGTFEFIPIPDGLGKDKRTYGNTYGRTNRLFTDYFPEHLRVRALKQPMHVDPEFSTFTYGDPTPPKAGLARLEKEDLLIFYAGLQGFAFTNQGPQTFVSTSAPALYIIGYFEVKRSVKAKEFTRAELLSDFGENFHVRHSDVFTDQHNELVLIKGSPQSRLLSKACCISSMSVDKAGKPLKVLSKEAQLIFGNFDGHVSIQRSPPRWIDRALVPAAAQFVRSLG